MPGEKLKLVYPNRLLDVFFVESPNSVEYVRRIQSMCGIGLINVLCYLPVYIYVLHGMNNTCRKSITVFILHSLPIPSIKDPYVM